MDTRLAAGFIFLILFQGCSTLSIRMATPMVQSQYASINEETDPLLAEQAIPASLKMLEGMLRDDPENESLLQNLSEGFCGYAFSFVEDTDPQRASKLYLRGRGYADRLLSIHGAPQKFISLNPDEFKNTLKTLNEDHLHGLYWMGQCWAGWLMLNLDDLQAFIAIPKVEAILQKTLELDESFHYAGPHLLSGAFYGGRSKMLGGDPDKARNHFDKCLELTQQKFLMAKVIYARTYAVQMQDRNLFQKLLKDVLDAPADILPGQQLANAVAKQKARKLLESVDDLF
ncbi:MAG: TRAP transporter TatT component family protein [Nitrospinota bacterium]|nr:TRAP transporter TatT component family protein [Nitrospinota bacterium]